MTSIVTRPGGSIHVCLMMAEKPIEPQKSGRFVLALVPLLLDCRPGSFLNSQGPGAQLAAATNRRRALLPAQILASGIPVLSSEKATT
jgi:hypothetical protein